MSDFTIQFDEEYSLYDTLMLVLKNAKCSFDIPQKRVAISNEEILRVLHEIKKGVLPLPQQSMILTKNLWIEKDSDRDRNLCIGPKPLEDEVDPFKIEKRARYPTDLP